MKSTEMLSGILIMLLFAVMDLSAQQTPSLIGDVAVNNDNTTDAVQVRHWVDRTAIFPGDKLNYYLDISCAADVDILLDDLEASQLVLTGLEVLGSDQTRTEMDGRTTYHMHYSLTTYDLTTQPLQIGAHIVRYFERSTAAQNGAPAGEVMIPATTLSLRSTLATEPLQSRLRDGLSDQIVTGGMNWVMPVGLMLILISGTPMAWWVLSLLRRTPDATQQHQRLHMTVKADQSVLEKLRGISFSNATERRQGYDQLDRILRDLLTQSSDVQTNALTAAEIAVQFSGRTLGVPVDQLAEVVNDCEQARYGKPEHLPAVDRFEAGIDLVRRLLIVH